MGPDGARWGPMGPGIAKVNTLQPEFSWIVQRHAQLFPMSLEATRPGSFFLPFAPICTLQNLHFQMFQSRQRWHGRVMGM